MQGLLMRKEIFLLKYTRLEVCFRLPVTMQIAMFHYPDLFSAFFQVEGCGSVKTRCETGPPYVAVIQIAVYKDYIMGLLHRMQDLTNTDMNVNTAGIGDEAAVLFYKD